MCPHVAIMFPKCPEETINGAEVTAEFAQRRKEEASKHQGTPDIHALLAQRRQRAAGRDASTQATP
jgi:hypothetical protein